MNAARIHRSGSADVIVVEDIPRPVPGMGEVLVRVAASLAGVVAAVGQGVSEFTSGDAVYGVTNPQFVGANAEYAIAAANMIAPKPLRLSSLEAAGLPED